MNPKPYDKAQVHPYTMNVGNRASEMTGRGLYLEIGQVEEQHVTHYESLMDPKETWFERLCLHEYTECWLYHSLAGQEPDPQAKRMWQQHLEQEIEHLHLACDLMRRQGNGKKDPEEMMPEELPAPLVFESNVDYVRGVLAGGTPSEQVIAEHKRAKGGEYRQELAGPHPVEAYRA